METMYRVSLAAAAIALAAAASVPAQSGVPAAGAGARVDTRRVIELPAAEQEHVMQEMQKFLVSIYGVMEASLRDDFKAAVAAARVSGGGLSWRSSAAWVNTS